MSDFATKTSGIQQSIWTATTRPLHYPKLKKTITVDVCIIGGGIAGLSTAYFLARKGKKIALIDDGYIGSGETGRTTAHLTNALDDRYFHIKTLHGKRKAKFAAESHTLAIDTIELITKHERIACDFERVSGYLFLDPTDTIETLKKEHMLLQDLGIHTALLKKTPLSTIPGPCLQFPNQAQFHPLKYLHGLARAIQKNKGQIYTRTHAQTITSDGVQTDDGHFIHAKHIVVATNVPINDRTRIHTKQAPYRTYVIAATIPKNIIPKALYWDTGNHTSTRPYAYHYARIYSMRDHDLLIVGGEDHKSGQPEESATLTYKKIEHWMRKTFPFTKNITYHWSGHIIEPIDAMAFLGKNPLDKNIYIATGDSGNGMTHGTIAGMLITDLIFKKENNWETLYDPSRKTLRALKEFFQENVNVAQQYTDLLTFEKEKTIKPGEGEVVHHGRHPKAYYHDGKKLHAYSAICPHLGCVVGWNAAEQTFDCPCHGSRFTNQGTVVNGPANKNLTPIAIRREQNMPPRGVKSTKRKRQYEHIKRSSLQRGRSPAVAKRIAAATTNKTRRQKGETKTRRK